MIKPEDLSEYAKEVFKNSDFNSQNPLKKPEMIEDCGEDIRFNARKLMDEALENVVKDVLRKYLGREPEIKDACRMTLYHNPQIPGVYGVSIDGNIAGKIVIEDEQYPGKFRQSFIYSIKFIPHDGTKICSLK